MNDVSGEQPTSVIISSITKVHNLSINKSCMEKKVILSSVFKL